MTSCDVVVIGAGHNGLACGAYLARAGVDTIVVEQAAEPGGCVVTEALPSGRGRLEIGAFEHSGLRASGVDEDLELSSRFGLEWLLSDELVLAPCDDGTDLALHNSLERTVEGFAAALGREEAERYRRFADWSARAIGVLSQANNGPPPTMRELTAAAELTLGAEGQRLIQALYASSSNLCAAHLGDPRLRGLLDHWAAHSQQPPDDPGTGAGAMMLAAFHGAPSARPAGGSQGTVDALVRCLEGHGGVLRTSAGVERIEVAGGRAVAVEAGGERITAGRAVVSAIDAKRVFESLIEPAHVPPGLREEVAGIHVGRRNVSELKVDGVLAKLPELDVPAGFERALMLSPNTDADIEAAFARIRLGLLPERPPLMIGFPSTREPGWTADPENAVIWLSTFVPWEPAEGPWTEATLEAAADYTWAAAERALRTELEPVERLITGPQDWVRRNGNPFACPNHVEMSLDQLLGMRPSPSLSRYATPVDGLYLSGAGSHPGGGVTGMPGRNAAAVVLADLGLRSRNRLERWRSQAAMLRDAARAARALRRAA
ncbi:MAG: NAD(P)/FAD-dependent oxidoreductase [Solirubrobacterales bacterium]